MLCVTDFPSGFLLNLKRMSQPSSQPNEADSSAAESSVVVPPPASTWDASSSTSPADDLVTSIPSSMPSVSVSASSRRLHLILDLDGTLVLDEAPSSGGGGGGFNSPVPRPHLRRFFSVCFSHCASVSLWTAASADWLFLVSQLLDEMKPPGAPRFLFEWAADRCSLRSDRRAIEEGDFYARRLATKPLRKVWRRGVGKANGIRKHNTLIVDDTPTTFVHNHGNALLIPSFSSAPQTKAQSAQEDDHLLRLCAFLPHLAAAADVRTIEKRGWHVRFAPEAGGSSSASASSAAAASSSAAESSSH